MAILKNIFQKIFVSNQVGSNYTSLNSAIAAIGTVKTFRIDSAMTLTANITFPAGVTLIIGAQGSITGAFTLTGNSTGLVFEGNGSEIGTNVIFAGTWLCGDITPEHFGAVGDGVTDDQTPLANMFAFTALTRTKTVTFGSYKTYYSTGSGFSVNNMVINGNFCKLLKDDSSILGCSGSIGTYYNLSSTAHQRDSWIKCSDADFISSLSAGDVVKIISDEICQIDAAENVPFGESHIVREIDAVNGIIYFNEVLFWSYTTANNARAARLSMTNIDISNITLWSIGEGSTAVAFAASYAFVKATNIFVKSFTYGIQLTDCFKPYIRMMSFQQDKEGIGYGVICTSATMYADISLVNIGCRHAFTTGGGAAGGITWGARVHDSIAFGSTIVGSGPFDTHASSGSVYFDNCIVYGGNQKANAIVGAEWDDTTTFDVDDIVYSLVKHKRFIALAESTNVDPDDNANYASWRRKDGNAITAFKSEGLYCYYNNCKAYNVAQGFYVSGPAMKEIRIRNCEVIDSINGIYSKHTASVVNLTIDGLRHYNEEPFTAGCAILLQTNITNLVLRNIHVKNIQLLSVLVPTSITTLKLSNFSAINDVAFPGIYFAGHDIKQFIAENGSMKNVSYLFASAYVAAKAANDLVLLQNINCDSPSGDVMSFGHPVSNVILSGISGMNPTAENYFVSATKNVTNLSVMGCGYIGTNATKLIFTDTDITLTYLLHNGNLLPNMTTFRTGVGALAATIITDGSLGIAGKVTT